MSEDGSAGMLLAPLAREEVRAAVSALVSGSPCPDLAPGSRFLLAHCLDGVVWGRRAEQGDLWSLSSTPFPDESGRIREDGLQQLRLFGPNAEALIWHDGESFIGRTLRDSSRVDADDPCRPLTERLVILGDRRRTSRSGFTVLADGAGSRHAVPLDVPEAAFTKGSWPLRLAVRHYFRADEATGVVRAVATRLVDLELTSRRSG